MAVRTELRNGLGVLNFAWSIAGRNDQLSAWSDASLWAGSTDGHTVMVSPRTSTSSSSSSVFSCVTSTLLSRDMRRLLRLRPSSLSASLSLGDVSCGRLCREAASN